MTVPVRPIASGYRSTNITSAQNLGLTTAQDARMVVKVVVVASSGAAGSIIDSTDTTPTAANTLLPIPAGTSEGTIYDLMCPCNAGLGVVPGAGGTLMVVWQ